jgi:hypothetical protein
MPGLGIAVRSVGRRGGTLALLGIGGLLATFPDPARAVPVHVELVVTSSSLSLFPTGTPLVLGLDLDPATPDSDARAGLFHFAQPGTATVPPFPDAVSVASVSGRDASAFGGVESDLWRASISGWIGDPSSGIQISIGLDLFGELLDPAQVLPRFTGSVTGQASAVVNFGGIQFVNANVVSVQVVPEPGASLLLSLGLCALAAGRRGGGSRSATR